MMNHKKYEKSFHMPPIPCLDWAKKTHVEKAPLWCSVDLRDGNQALIVPMSLEQKLEFFKILVDIGFKNIEVGFPAASETEYKFIRTLIEENMIPDDVTIQVLTQAREHIIKKTFEALEGAKSSVVHVYNSTSVAQREQVFRKSKEEIMDIAVKGAELLKKLADETEGNFSFQYSPESFTGTEMEYALEVCNKVIDIWQPTPDNKVIINIPSTVENAMPHIYATQVEYFDKNLNNRENVLISLHAHNDRGCGVAASEMGMLAGADKIEGTLFGNGERTGNADIVTLAMNMYSQGVDPQLNFENMPYIVEKYEEFTQLTVPERQPYAGSLVFAAFSGSHQDAIAKGMKWREENNCETWTVPYLPIDPTDIGRNYDADVIRINSQSGKGGVSYILEQQFGFVIPVKMREIIGYATKDVSDKAHKELSHDEIYDIFMERFVDIEKPFKVLETHFKQIESGIEAEVTIENNGEKSVISGKGNGRLDAVSNAVKDNFKLNYELDTYQEHSMETGSTSRAISYVGIKNLDEKDQGVYWGVGTDEDIIDSSIHALITAINKKVEA